MPDSIEADEKRLRQILINLLNNAIKFTERGRVILKVTAIDKTLDYEQKYEQKIRFEVIDTGVGISQVEQSKIFQPFEQADQARLKNVGTGLGLSISQQLVRLMGGTLQVKSKLGQGSNFWFEALFPLRESKSNSQKQSLKIELELTLPFLRIKIKQIFIEILPFKKFQENYYQNSKIKPTEQIFISQNCYIKV